MSVAYRAVAAALLASLVVTPLAMAQSGGPSTQQIIDRLKPAPVTRGFTVPNGRGISVEPGEAPAPQKLSIDLPVPFEFNSDRLTTDGSIIVDRLAHALIDPALVTYRFEIAGHTDATGSDAYNDALSRRRAETVRALLVTKYHVDAKRLTAMGYGKRRLADPANPTDGVNRRVEIVNLGSQ